MRRFYLRIWENKDSRTYNAYLSAIAKNPLKCILWKYSIHTYKDWQQSKVRTHPQKDKKWGHLQGQRNDKEDKKCETGVGKLEAPPRPIQRKRNLCKMWGGRMSCSSCYVVLLGACRSHFLMNGVGGAKARRPDRGGGETSNPVLSRWSGRKGPGQGGPREADA